MILPKQPLVTPDVSSGTVALVGAIGNGHVERQRHYCSHRDGPPTVGRYLSDRCS